MGLILLEMRILRELLGFWPDERIFQLVKIYFSDCFITEVIWTYHSFVAHSAPNC